jgi:hypothetical protein
LIRAFGTRVENNGIYRKERKGRKIGDSDSEYWPQKTQGAQKRFTAKDPREARNIKFPNLRVLRITVSQNLRGTRKFSDMEDISESDHSPAKAQRRQVQRRIFFLQNLCAFAPLREIFRDLDAAPPRWAFVVNQ